MKDHNKKINHYLPKGQFKLVFNDNQDYKNLMTDMINIYNKYIMVKLLERSN